MSWFLRPDRWPITPMDWLKVADDLARAPTRVLLDAFASLTSALVGKELELRGPGATVTLHLDSVTGSHSAPPVALGAWRPGLDLEGLEAVDIEAHDVRWEDGTIDRLSVQASNVHLEGGLVADLVAGPIGLAGEIGQATLDELLQRHDVGLAIVLDGTDRATVWPSRTVRASVSAELDHDVLTFPVHRVWWRGIRLPLVHRFVETRTVTVPPLPRGLRLIGLSSSPGVVRATAVLDEFREPLMLEQVLRAASTVGSHVVLNRVNPGKVT